MRTWVHEPGVGEVEVSYRLVTSAGKSRNRDGKERLGEIDVSVKMRTTSTWTERP